MSNHSSSNLLHKSWPSALPKTIIVSSQWQLGACLAPWHGAQNVNIIWHSTPKTWLNTWTYTDINVDKWQSSNHSKCFPVFQVFLTFTSVHPFPASGWSIHKTNSGKKKNPEETLGTISLWSRALRRGETGFQRLGSPGGWLRCLFGCWAGSVMPTSWGPGSVWCLCWYFILFQLLVLVNWIFFLLMILAMNVFKAFFDCERYPKVYKKADGSKLPNKNRASLQTAFKQFGYF